MGKWKRDRSDCRGRHIYSCKRRRKTGRKVRIVSIWIQMCVRRVYIIYIYIIHITRNTLDRNAMELLGIDKNSLSWKLIEFLIVIFKYVYIMLTRSFTIRSFAISARYRRGFEHAIQRMLTFDEWLERKRETEKERESKRDRKRIATIRRKKFHDNTILYNSKRNRKNCFVSKIRILFSFGETGDTTRARKSWQAWGIERMIRKRTGSGKKTPRCFFSRRQNDSRWSNREIRSNKFIVINLFPLVVTAYMILDVGRIRVTFVAIRTLDTTYTAQMTYVIIEIFPPFEPLPASIAVQIVAIEIRIRIFHATNLVFLFARVPHVERQISLLGKRLAALRTLYSVRPCTGRRVFPFWKLKTQTRYVEQTFSRASIPSRLSKVKGGGGISSPFRSLCGPPLCVYVYVHVCTISLCTIHVCVYACTCTYRESEKKILNSVDWSVDI